jgi:hemolysin III
MADTGSETGERESQGSDASGGWHGTTDRDRHHTAPQAPGAHPHLRERADDLRERAVERAEEAYDAFADRLGQTVADAVDRVSPAVKPKLRGWLHLGAVPVALLGTLALLLVADQPAAEWSVAVYGLTSLLLFGGSAAYHVGTWGPRAERTLKRVDHANIYLIIAGTYTPFATLLLDGTQRQLLLWLVWTGAGLGVLFRVVWLSAPRWLYVAAYIALGWVAVFFLPDIVRAGGVWVAVLLLAGGLAYTVGALVYATKRPDPSPRWFGYHEVFHTCTLVAWVCHYVGVMLVVATRG